LARKIVEEGPMGERGREGERGGGERERGINELREIKKG
jgi:hypothetical protein